MRISSKAVFSVGLLLFVFSVCCIDSPGIYGFYAAVACIAGEIFAVAGYASFSRKKQQAKEMCFFAARRPDRTSRDLEIIDFGMEGIETNLNGAGYEKMKTGIFVSKEDAYAYALESLSLDENLQEEFVEWFYSGNWIKED